MLPKMKIWLKYLIAAIVGAAAGLVVPPGDSAILDSIAAIALNVSRYALLPLTFFSVAVAAFELHDEKRLHRVWFRTVLYSLVTVFVLTLIGLAGAFAFSPGRIPLLTETAQGMEAAPTFFGILKAVIPPDALSTLALPDFLLPASLFSMVIGLGFAFDRTATKPVVALFDSLSRILWQINSFFVEILPLPLIAAAASRAAAMGRTARLPVFGPLLATLGFETAFVILALLPFAMWLINRRRNPYKTLLAMAAPAIAALVSGNSYAQAGVAAKHLKESLGVRRRSGAVSMPLVLAFGRAGTAMVSATAFVAILNSYSNLGLGANAVLWMMAAVPAIALLLGAAPGSGPLVALAALCASYGRGFESGYILLLPAALPLAMIAAFVDSACMSAVVAAVASKEGYCNPKDLRHYI